MSSSNLTINTSSSTISSSTTINAVPSSETIVQQCGFLPLVAILPSAGADLICKKNNITSFSDLISPFSSVVCVIKDPYGQQQSTKVKIDFRDVSKSGCLWSLTVLPSVLHQVVSSISILPQFASTEVWNSSFRDSFCYWLEPSENDFFKTYLCCIFVISAEEEDPIGELTRLVQQQHTQQHGGAESANVLGPAHCAPPKWFLPNILKYYVVLHDVLEGSEEKANEVFAKVSASYGSDCCHILKINSTNDADLPDPWQQILEHRYRGLESGLEMARKKIMEKTSSAESLASDSSKPTSSLVPLSTPSNSSMPVFSTSSAAANPTATPSLSAAHYSVTNNTISSQVNGGTNMSPRLQAQNSITSLSQARYSHGQCLTTSDREQLRDFVEKFVKHSLIPFVEKQIIAQNDVLQNRRGLGKSITSMRKWFSAASSSATAAAAAASGASPVSYGAESAEIQTRRLADMAFLFGMYPFSHQLYQQIKKDFSNDQAWLYHAGALEMAALTLYLSSNQLSPKQFPMHYLENALKYYLETCMQPMLAVRCSIITVEILSRVGMHLHAANQLIRLTSTISDLFSGVLLEKAASLFHQVKMFRRKAFHLVLAGHRFNQAGQPLLSLKCYDQAASEYLDKGWDFAEDHIMFTLSHESKDPEYQGERVTRLVRPYSFQFMDQQSAFIEHYLKILHRNGVKHPCFVIPLINSQDIKIIYGEKPDTLPSSSTSSSNEENVSGPKKSNNNIKDKESIEWEDLERIAFHAGAGAKKGFNRPCPMFSDSTTKNREKKQTPPYERFRVQIKLINPMNVPLILRNIRLGIKEVQMREGFVETDAFIEHGTIPELILPPTELPFKPEMSVSPYPKPSETLIELHVIPTDKLQYFSISSILFDFCGSTTTTPTTTTPSVSGHLPIEIIGKRLFKTKDQRMKKVYGTDNRLHTQVSEAKWPLLNIELSGQAARSPEIHAYASQMFQVLVNFENIGDIPISSVTISTDQPELVSISEPSTEDHQKWSLCLGKMNPNGVFVHTVNQPWVEQLKSKGGKLTLRMAIKAPDEVVENKIYRILFFYIGENGNIREFRYSIKMTTQNLLRCVPKILKENYQLCAIDVKNLIPNRDAVLAKVEVLRLSAIMTTPEGKEAEALPIGMDLVMKRQVVVECDQSDTLPFFVKIDPYKPSTIWLTDVINDIPSFNNIVPHYLSLSRDNQQQNSNVPATLIEQNLIRAHLRFSLLWRAQIANTDGTVATLFGETWIVNPFSIDKIQKFLSEPIYEEGIYFSTGIPQLNGKFGMVLLEQDRKAILAAKPPSYNLETKKIIQWKQSDSDDLKEINKEVSRIILGKIIASNEPYIHDFKIQSVCRISITLEIHNADPLQRSAHIWIYTCGEISEMKSPPLKEKSIQLGDGEAGALDVSTTTNTQNQNQQQSQQLRSQPKLSCERPIIQRKIDFGQTLTFPLTFKAFTSFGYNLGEVIGAEIMFIEKNESTAKTIKSTNSAAEKQYHRLDIPLTYVFVKSAAAATSTTPKMISTVSRESTISPAMSIKSNESLNHHHHSQQHRLVVAAAGAGAATTTNKTRVS